jgi:hypothetical protein
MEYNMSIYTSKIVSVLVTTFLLHFICGCTTAVRGPEATHIVAAESEKEKLIGRWEGVSNGETGLFVFTADGRADIFKSGVSMQESIIENQGYISFSVDSSIYPHHLDLILVSSSGKELGRLKMIFEFISQHKIRLRIFFNGDRPTQFVSDQDENTIILSRKAED